MTMAAAIILNRGGYHTKVDCHANYANCDMLAVLISFQIFVLSAVQSFSKTEWYFYKKKPKMCFFIYRCYFFCTQLYMALLTCASVGWKRVAVYNQLNGFVPGLFQVGRKHVSLDLYF